MEKYYGLDFLTDFLEKMYIQEYIPAGGSKIKFITGRLGSGKSTLLRALGGIASENGYQVTAFSAKQIPLNDFKYIYAETFRQTDIEKVLTGCAKVIIRNMGYEPEEIGVGMTFCDYLSSQNENNALTKREIRNQLKAMFWTIPALTTILLSRAVCSRAVFWDIPSLKSKTVRCLCSGFQPIPL